MVLNPDFREFVKSLNDNAARVEVLLDDLPVNFIDLQNLRIAKATSGRFQDLADLEHLQ